MKKTVRFIASALAVLVLTACFAGCGSGSDSPAAGGKEKKKAQSFKIEDIDWKVDAGIVDGERFVLMNYTNNSKYTVVGFEMQFRQKDGITEEEKEKYFNDLKKMVDLDESDPEEAEDFEELKKEEISMHAKSERLAKSGETVSAIYCQYYDGYYEVTDIAHYSLVVPDVATVKYIDDSKVVTTYYDFVSKNYSTEDGAVTSFYWTEKGLEKVIPKPEAEYVAESGMDESDYFSFDVYGWTSDDFQSYVKQCREAGFTVDASEDDDYYSAEDTNGYHIFLNYDKDLFSMSATAKDEDE